jgi:hypothetical protein
VKAKRNLMFCRLTQDGTGEGIFRLDRLPTREKAETIRDILVIPKKREISDAERERLRAMASLLQSRPGKEPENTPWESSPPGAQPGEERPRGGEMTRLLAALALLLAGPAPAADWATVPDPALTSPVGRRS